MRLVKKSILKHVCMVIMCATLIIALPGVGFTVKAEEANSNNRDHTHYFNQHYAQNAGFTENAYHPFTYGYNIYGEPISKTCYSYIIHTYYIIGCNCGTMCPGAHSHEHPSSKQHPLTSDPNDCKLGNQPIDISTVPDCYN